MPNRHFYLLRHHILFYIKFLLFCSLTPDEIRILCKKIRGFPRSIQFLFKWKTPEEYVNPLDFNSQRIHNLLENPHSLQL